MTDINSCDSNSRAKKLILGNGVKINSQIINNPGHIIENSESFELSVGKKKFYKIIFNK